MTPEETMEIVEVFRAAGRLLLKVRLASGSSLQIGDTLEGPGRSYVVNAVSFSPVDAWQSGLRLIEVDGVPEPLVGECLRWRRPPQGSSL